MKRDTVAFTNRHLIISERVAEKCARMFKRLRELSFHKAHITLAIIFELGVDALEKEITLDPVKTVRLCLPKETDYIKIFNIDGISHYQAYCHSREVNASGQIVQKRLKVAGRGVLPYLIHEGRYKVK